MLDFMLDGTEKGNFHSIWLDLRFLLDITERYDGKLKSCLFTKKYNYFISIQLSQDKTIAMPYVRGYEEDGFLKQLDITRQTLEILSEDKVKKLDNY